MTPGPNEQLSSDSATFGPNHTDTSAISTVGLGGERRIDSSLRGCAAIAGLAGGSSGSHVGHRSTQR